MNKVFHACINYIKTTDKLLWLICICTSAFGAALVYSATRTVSISQFRTQVIAIVIGYLAAFVITKLDYQKICSLWIVIAVLCIGLMAATSIFGSRVEGADDKAWIILPGGMSIQPSEIVKIGFIVTFAKHLDILRRKNKLKSFPQVMLLCLHMAVPVGIIHLQGDDGAALVFFFIFLAMCFGAGIQLRYFAALGVALCAAVPLAWKFILNTDQKKRIQILLDHSLDPLGYGYQQGQGEISIGSGMMNGRGLFQGPRVARGIVPEDHNDFIFSVAGEELGFIGCVAILILIGLILFKIMLVARASQDPMGKYICYGFFGMLAFQTIENVGMCLYLLPVVGITLPFFSAGGSSAACLYFGVGLVQSVYMHRYKKKDLEFSSLEDV